MEQTKQRSAAVQNAIESFSNAAYYLLHTVYKDDVDLSDAYPFHESFEEICARIEEWENFRPEETIEL